MIDSPLPRNHQPLPQEIVAYILSNNQNNANGATNNKDVVNPHLLAEFKLSATLLGSYSAPSTAPIKTVMLRNSDVFDTEALCGVKYDWLSSQKTRDEAIEGWEEILGTKVDVLEIPGNHFEAFDEQYVSLTDVASFYPYQKLIDQTDCGDFEAVDEGMPDH